MAQELDPPAMPVLDLTESFWKCVFDFQYKVAIGQCACIVLLCFAGLVNILCKSGPTF